jgi:vacuolar iron transporter family protein
LPSSWPSSRDGRLDQIIRPRTELGSVGFRFQKKTLEEAMPAVEHVEKHFTATAAVRDVVIGMSDGLTVPFALAAGLTTAATVLSRGTSIIVTAGLAEIAAGSIAMGLGGYLAAKTDSEHYASELQREYRETVELPDVEIEEVAKVFRDYGLTPGQMKPVVDAITSAASYVIGGLVPLAPYIAMNRVFPALWTSVGVTLLALFVFGSIKGHYTGVRPWRSGLQTVLVGGLAAAAAFFIARLVV